MKYETLKAGDVRKKGDEVCSHGFRPDIHYTWEGAPHEWHKTHLIGHEILGSDMAHLEFRRPVK